jgi:hypothetical protein
MARRDLAVTTSLVAAFSVALLANCCTSDLVFPGEHTYGGMLPDKVHECRRVRPVRATRLPRNPKEEEEEEAASWWDEEEVPNYDGPWPIYTGRPDDQRPSYESSQMVARPYDNRSLMGRSRGPSDGPESRTAGMSHRNGGVHQPGYLRGGGERMAGLNRSSCFFLQVGSYRTYCT